MNIGVVGSRTFTSKSFMDRVLSPFFINGNTIISGGAVGADSIAEYLARGHTMPVKIIKPDWNKYGKSAGFIRNKEIVKQSDHIIAFWDGKSKGTEHTINLALKKGIYVEVHWFYE